MKEILAANRDLEVQITQLLIAYEQKTGVTVAEINLIDFERGSIRSPGMNLDVHVKISLPSDRYRKFGG